MGVGVITPEECKALGVSGPIARASGIKWDLRKAFPYSGIDKYEFDVPTGKHGDVWDRYLVRIQEIKQKSSRLASSSRFSKRCRPATTAPPTAR